MKIEPYLKIRKPSIRYAYFFYFDVTPYLADQIFIRHEIGVRFGKEFAKEDSPYRGILCRIRKKDVQVFESCMKELKRNMMICGHPDYEQEILKLLKGFDHLKGMVNSNEDDAADKTKQKETA